MPYDKRKHHRRSIRLPGYDYTSPGAYFVTICVHGGECLLGQIVDGEMRLSRFGQVAGQYWKRIPNHVAQVELDEWVVMPNHIHGIIIIHAKVKIILFQNRVRRPRPYASRCWNIIVHCKWPVGQPQVTPAE